MFTSRRDAMQHATLVYIMNKNIVVSTNLKKELFLQLILLIHS